MKKIPILFMTVLFLITGFAYAQESGEMAKIQYLISTIETLKGAKFIRNGKAYEAKTAADHLRRKLTAANDRVKTADDFIELCASKSSISGLPYQIRFSDGSTMESNVFFRNKLRAFSNLPFHP
jgi:hypothetical protein